MSEWEEVKRDEATRREGDWEMKKRGKKIKY